MSMLTLTRRPVMVIWVPDLHLNCSFSQLFAPPLPFTLLEEEIPRANLSDALFQVFNYMRPEPGAIKDEASTPLRLRACRCPPPRAHVHVPSRARGLRARHRFARPPPVAVACLHTRACASLGRDGARLSVGDGALAAGRPRPRPPRLLPLGIRDEPSCRRVDQWRATAGAAAAHPHP